LFQRIAVVNTLLPLREEESRAYIDHRLSLAGHSGNGLFTAEAIEAILHHSEGVPRKINRVCFNALSRGCESGTRVIDEGIVQQVSLELDITPLVQARESKLAQAKNSASRTRIHIARQRLQPRVPIARQPASSAVQPAASILPLPPSLPPKDGVANRPTPALPTAASKAIEAVASVSARLMRRARKSPPYVLYALAVVVLCAAGALVFRTSTTAGAYVAAREVEKVPITYPAALQPGHVDTEIVSDLAGREVRDDRSGATEVRAAAPSVARRAHAFVVAALDDATIRQPDTVPEDELSEPVSPPVVNAGADDGHIRGIVATSVASDPVLASSAYSGGKLRRRVLPTYPPWAKQSRIEGTVVLNANVTPGGKVENIKVLSGNAALAQAAIEAVAHWRYEPFRVGGKPVAGETLIRVNFKLSQVRP
jgi:TonB family protein